MPDSGLYTKALKAFAGIAANNVYFPLSDYL